MSMENTVPQIDIYWRSHCDMSRGSNPTNQIKYSATA